jgi:hypothetical protein
LLAFLTFSPHRASPASRHICKRRTTARGEADGQAESALPGNFCILTMPGLTHVYPENSGKHCILRMARRLRMAGAKGLRMIDKTGHAALPPAAARSSAPAFSYAFAEKSLRAGASQSLAAHGAKFPATEAAGGAGSRADVRAAAIQPAGQSASPSTRATTQASPDARGGAPLTASPVGSAQTASLAGPATTGPVAGPGTAAVGAARAAPPALSSLPSPHAGRDALRPSSTRAPGAPPPPKTEEFARLIAQRLEAATRFDLTIGDGTLGGIEGRMILGDDGAATLALTFDRMETFQQFAGDEAVLRAHLSASGFQFGEGALRLSHRTPDDHADQATDESESRADASLPLIAPAGGRALDIMI